MRIFFTLLLFLYTLSSKAVTWTVSQSGETNSITTAIQKANNGDTILVNPGHYREGNIQVNKEIVLLGIDYPVVDGEFKHEVFTITANNVTIRNFNIINVGVSSLHDKAAIGGENARNLYLADNKIEMAFFGIHLANCKSSLIENNTLTAAAVNESATGNGIHLWKSDKITVKNNTVDGHRDGIYFEFVTNSLIENNISINNLRYGLHFMFSHNDEYNRNLFKNNGSGIAVMYSKGVTMRYNRFEENWGSSVFGLLLKEISESTIEHNLFIRNTVAIYMEACSRSNFKGNEFRGNGWGIKLQASCDDNIFEENNFIANSFDMGTNGSMTLNTIRSNYWDKYGGYDLDKDGVGDVPFHPVSMYSMIIEKMPTAVMLWRSFLVFLLDRAEKIIPVVTPENLKDDVPVMKPYDISI
ncbi:MAG TPA: nitrous oxide reductase family maturation protein NosD [Cyclobacteriaceae bacterium]|nr:nitrous oxide reductase family maturation protein NosD [Cyclobacteriaceae bacterium]HRK54692.1 nitrous oxide reductase family maturation protein NosD [Cyclobacteriaceae bacterium]